MNIRQLDLNLLLVFDAVYRERSISAAARKLNLSQPAVSNALTRLRQFTDDKLFFRSGHEMIPTRAANSLAVPIRHALSAVEVGLSSLRSFDPATSTRTFRLGVNDFFRHMLIPTMANVIEREAPNIKLEFLVETLGAPVLLESLRLGEVDLSHLPLAVVEGLEDISFEHISNEKLQLMVRAGHPALSKPITLEVLSKLKYVATSNAPAVRTLVDHIFGEHGIKRDVVCVVPDTTTIPATVEMTDLVGVTSSNFLLRHQRDHALVALDTPLEFPAIRAGLVWSRAADEDQGHQWLREKAAQILRAALSVSAPVTADAL
ncbi:MAG: LysR substrate-binding domain-containing protein [Parvibaculum sp.]|nr:LysR substrate-binding domain-containing protein [Parvibaculum sp.]